MSLLAANAGNLLFHVVAVRGLGAVCRVSPGGALTAAGQGVTGAMAATLAGRTAYRSRCS